MKNILVIASGGTGGHLFPAKVLGEEAKRRGFEVIFLLGGTKTVWEDAFFQVRRISTSEISLKKGVILGSVKIFRGFLQAFFLLLKWKKLSGRLKVVASGSYACFPVLLAAFCLKCPYYLLEQNVIPGLTTRIFAPFARGVFVAFRETRDFLKSSRVFYSGNPLRFKRREAIDPLSSKREAGLNLNLPLVLVSGGSQGAKVLAYLVLELARVIPSLQFLIQTGFKHFNELVAKFGERGSNYRIFPFSYEMEKLYGIADLVVSRAGGGSVAELLYFQIPSILVPFRGAKAHQLENAKVLEKWGCALVIEEKNLTLNNLAQVILELFADPIKLKTMRKNLKKIVYPDATQIIFKLWEAGW